MFFFKRHIFASNYLLYLYDTVLLFFTVLYLMFQVKVKQKVYNFQKLVSEYLFPNTITKQRAAKDHVLKVHFKNTCERIF